MASMELCLMFPLLVRYYFSFLGQFLGRGLEWHPVGMDCNDEGLQPNLVDKLVEMMAGAHGVPNMGAERINLTTRSVITSL
ncbi:hypothetical protein PoB_005994700 [Plakobranchus ocellatus]|uniref:Uncharacterized protein n=1 Tax=Plakobranchus ocellatus TaxID=259542 RepID=A0AAV4CNK2_9GAST|nr:hypothetical protein PoB_005994700 [Plakobranchus ocellatus]